jgi:hypothetical protein
MLSSSKDPGIAVEWKTVFEKALDEALDESESVEERKLAPEKESSRSEPRKDSMRLTT